MSSHRDDLCWVLSMFLLNSTNVGSEGVSSWVVPVRHSKGQQRIEVVATIRTETRRMPGNNRHRLRAVEGRSDVEAEKVELVEGSLDQWASDNKEVGCCLAPLHHHHHKLVRTRKQSSTWEGEEVVDSNDARRWRTTNNKAIVVGWCTDWAEARVVELKM